jgi:hypothetical protein
VIKDFFDQATHLQRSVAAIDGMSSVRIQDLLNRIIRSCNGRARYLEVGAWKGSTFFAAICDNEYEIAVAVDNFSQFEGRYARQDFYANYARYNTVNTVFLEGDFFTPHIKNMLSVKAPFNVFFYDGEHSEENQRRAITESLPLLGDRFILIVDDWNWPEVRKGTMVGIEMSGLTIEDMHEEITGFNGVRETWWNGIAVMGVRK